MKRSIFSFLDQVSGFAEALITGCPSIISPYACLLTFHIFNLSHEQLSQFYQICSNKGTCLFLKRGTSKRGKYKKAIKNLVLQNQRPECIVQNILWWSRSRSKFVWIKGHFNSSRETYWWLLKSCAESYSQFQPNVAKSERVFLDEANSVLLRFRTTYFFKGK